MLQRDVRILLWKYMKSTAIFDIAANIPILYSLSRNLLFIE